MSERDAAACQIVGRDFEGHSVARENADAKPAHLPCYRRVDFVSVGDEDAERRIR